MYKRASKTAIILTFIFFIVIIFLFTPNFLKAQENHITMPIDAWPPFRIIEKQHNRGIDLDLLKEIEKRLDIKIVYKKYPWTRSLAYMKNGKVDAMSGLAKRSERAKYIQYTNTPYYTCSTVFYVRKGEKDIIKTYADLQNYLIGYVDNSAYFAPFDTDKTLNKRAVTNEAQLIRMLAFGRIKVMIGTDCQVDYDIKKLGLLGKFEKTIYKPNNKVDLYLGISKKSKLIKDIDKINQTIQDIIDDGLIKDYAKKYYE